MKIGLFHLGSGMADVITTGVWNRVMISDLGFSATPIGLLIALRYFLAPLGVWAGRMSDERSIGGYRRLFWIWLGRSMMAVSIAMLGFATAHVARGGAADFGVWGAISLALLLFSLGGAFSGSTFLALIYDRSAEHQRGRAVGIVWTFLLIGFTVGGVLFGLLLPDGEDPNAVRHSEIYAVPSGSEAAPVVTTETAGVEYSPETLQNLFLIGAAVMAGLWFFSLLGEERRSSGAVQTGAGANESSTSLKADIKLVWRNPQLRFFFWFLALSMAFAFSQDLILEPFAADVFDMPARVTSRFSAYWGSMAILGTIAFLLLSRRYKVLTNTMLSSVGVIILAVTFALFALSAWAEIRWLVTPGLILLGLGLGIWNVGALGLMVDMSPAGRAGTFLGFWTLVVTFARGLGVSGGGILRDVGVLTGGSYGAAYGAAFLIGAVGLAVSLWALRRVNVRQFKAEIQSPRADTATILAGAMD
jgi:BCD family chlorophyll transporter-like MFS transporter